MSIKSSCAEPADSPESTSYAWDISHALATTYHPYCHSPGALTEYLKEKLHQQQAKRLSRSLPAQVKQNVSLEHNNVPRSTLPTTHTPMPEPWGGISDITAGSVAGSTTSMNTKKQLMHPGTSKMARLSSYWPNIAFLITNAHRNLFVINYCKDHIVTCEEFSKVWINMATEEKEVCLHYTHSELTLIAMHGYTNSGKKKRSPRKS